MRYTGLVGHVPQAWANCFHMSRPTLRERNNSYISKPRTKQKNLSGEFCLIFNSWTGQLKIDRKGGWCTAKEKTALIKFYRSPTGPQELLNIADQAPGENKSGLSLNEKKEYTYPWVLLGRNENSFFEFEILSSKQVQIRFLLWLFLDFTFLDLLNLCKTRNPFNKYVSFTDKMTN